MFKRSIWKVVYSCSKLSLTSSLFSEKWAPSYNAPRGNSHAFDKRCTNCRLTF